jgi:multimeric flavodoxin WrbA
MKMVVLSGNPKKEGLCHSITDELIRGAKDGGAEVEEISTNNMTACHVCGDGWGVCKTQRKCKYGNDGFTAAQKSIEAADAIVIISPVYFGEVTETLKSFLDRLRRCENSLGPNGRKAALTGKSVILVASAGGLGINYSSALTELKHYCQFTGAIVFKQFGINRRNSDHKREVIYNAAKAMVSGRKPRKPILKSIVFFWIFRRKSQMI